MLRHPLFRMLMSSYTLTLPLPLPIFTSIGTVHAYVLKTNHVTLSNVQIQWPNHLVMHCPQSNVRNSLQDTFTGGVYMLYRPTHHDFCVSDIWEVVSSSQLELFISHPTSCYCLKINRVVDNPSDCCKQTLWFLSFF